MKQNLPKVNPPKRPNVTGGMKIESDAYRRANPGVILNNGDGLEWTHTKRDTFLDIEGIGPRKEYRVHGVHALPLSFVTRTATSSVETRLATVSVRTFPYSGPSAWMDTDPNVVIVRRESYEDNYAEKNVHRTRYWLAWSTEVHAALAFHFMAFPMGDPAEMRTIESTVTEVVKSAPTIAVRFGTVVPPIGNLTLDLDELWTEWRIREDGRLRAELRRDREERARKSRSSARRESQGFANGAGISFRSLPK